MNDIELNAHRVARLEAAVRKLCAGNKTEFARRLGYKDGAFVRQMTSGTRPVSEKTIRAIESLPGMKGWFDLGAAGSARVVEPAPPETDTASRYAAASPEAKLLVDLVLLRPDEKWPPWATPPMHSLLTAALEAAGNLQGVRRKSA